MINFKKITFQNFLSVGNHPVSLNLNEHKTTLVHGVNGSGKSTILDALTYVLFNKSFRGTTLPLLINTQNKKGLVVEVEFSVGSDEYVVKRGQKPKVFTIHKNGTPYDNQAADKDTQKYLENNVLKLTYKSFCQIVILGSSSYIPFMQMTTAGRRECVEDFLDIKVFSTMSALSKDRLKTIKLQERDLKKDIGVIEYKIDNTELFIKDLKSQSQSLVDELNNKISERTKDKDRLLKEREETVKHQNYLMEMVASAEKSKPEKKLMGLQRIQTEIQTKNKSHEENVEFYSDNDSCHTCKQSISQEIKEEQIKVSNNLIEKNKSTLLEMEEHIKDFQDKVDYIYGVNNEIRDTQSKLSVIDTKIGSCDREVLDYKNQINKIETSPEAVNREEGKLELLQDELKESKDKLLELMNEIGDYEVVTSLLKDSGIKTQIIKKYLPVMNNLIRKYLSDLDYPIHFQLDNEFNETIKSPQQQDFTYSSFSEGQKGRIDLSVLFMWREICRMKNSVSCNLLVLDEVFSSSLDDTGKECLMNLIRYGLDNKTNVVVVDHTLSSEFKEKFNESIEVQRIKGFSVYS